MNELVIDGYSLTIDDFLKVVNDNVKIKLATSCFEKINKSQQLVEHYVQNDVLRYSLTTGLGQLANIKLDKKDTSKMQENLIYTRAIGTGQPLNNEVVRGLLLLKINEFAQGSSGVRLELINLLVAMLNENVLPVIPIEDGLRVYDDSIALAHLGLSLIGGGEVFYQDKKYSSKLGLKKAGLDTIVLISKEATSLISGNALSLSLSLLSYQLAYNCVKLADMSLALSCVALEYAPRFFDQRLFQIKDLGVKQSLDNVTYLLEESSSLKDFKNISKSESILRISILENGDCYNVLDNFKVKLENELNYNHDMLLVFNENDEIINSINYYSNGLAMLNDFLAIAFTKLSNVIHQRIEVLLDSNLSNGLPTYLIKKGGTNTGLNALNYSIASLIKENKLLATPTTTQTISNFQNFNDLSSSSLSAKKSMDIIENTRMIIAMELLCASQAIDLRKVDHLGNKTELIYQLIRNKVVYMKQDRSIRNDLIKLKMLLNSDELLEILK